MFTISELMTPEPLSLREEDSLELADAVLAGGHFRHLPVVREGKLVGLITHRDLLRHSHRADLRTGKPVRAGEVMIRKVITVRPETPVREAVQLMLAHKFGCLPVTREDGTLLGILTNSDLLKVAAQLAEERDLRDLAREYE